MSDYIEDRIKRLETRLGTQAIDITAQQFSIKELTERVKAIEKTVEDLKEQMNILADDYKIFREEDHADQSTEEFVKVVRCEDCKWKGQPKCPMTFSASGYGGYDVRLIDPTCDDDYCSRGEKR